MVLRNVIEQPLPELSRSKEPVPAELMRILAKNPEERYQHADDLGADLRAARRLFGSARHCEAGHE
ncbi:MAG: hypothetical protein HY235_24145 [Acidobacteria bacterium]|nr:hypothetical protein [Acidobacteriota bacterium]